MLKLRQMCMLSASNAHADQMGSNAKEMLLVVTNKQEEWKNGETREMERRRKGLDQ